MWQMGSESIMACSLRIEIGTPSDPTALCGKCRSADETASAEIWGQFMIRV